MEGVTTALGELVDVVTTNVLPLLTSKPLVYWLAAGIFGLCCGIFARAKGII